MDIHDWFKCDWIKKSSLFLASLAFIVSSNLASAAVDNVRAWGWAHSANATLNTPYQAYSGYSRSAGWENIPNHPYRNYYSGDVMVTRKAVGYYSVLFEQMNATGGVVHVTAYGGNHHCKVQNWYPTVGGQLVNVRCFNNTGSAANGRFTVLYYKNTTKGDYYTDGYLWANNPTAASYTPSSTYQSNSGDVLNTVTRLSTGRYRVNMPTMNISSGENTGGTVMVTAYGSNSDRCKVRSWYFSGADLNANVDCYNSAGSLTDSRYTLSFMKRITIGNQVAEDLLQGAYVWANWSPTPYSYYQYSYSGQPIERHDNSTGNYRIEIPGLKANGGSTTVSVTAYGGNGNHCSIGYWGNSWVYGDGTTANVRCYDSNGNPANTLFTLQYITSNIILY